MLSPKLSATAPPRTRSPIELGLVPTPCASYAVGEAPGMRGFPKIPCRDAPSPSRFGQRSFRNHGISHAVDAAPCAVHRDLATGRSPDLVAATKSARDAGARTIAIVNATSSPVANEAEFVVPIEAGQEHSVAATKTVIGSMAAGARLVAELAKDQGLRSALDRLPTACTERWHSTGPKLPMISPRRQPYLWRRGAWAWAAGPGDRAQIFGNPAPALHWAECRRAAAWAASCVVIAHTGCHDAPYG